MGFVLFCVLFMMISLLLFLVTLLLLHISSVLPFDDSEAFEGLLSQGKCFAVLQGMARGKASGCDGHGVLFQILGCFG